MQYAIGLEYKKIQIKEAVRKMHAALARRGTLAEPVIEAYSEMVAARMHGQIRSTVVSPATSKLLGAGFAVIEQSLVQTVVYNKYELEQQFLLENYKRAGFTGIGVAAGDEPEEKKQVIEDENLEPEQQIYQAPKTLDLSPDRVFLENLLSIFEMDQDSEIARMLNGYQLNSSQPFTPYISGDYSLNSSNVGAFWDPMSKINDGLAQQDQNLKSGYLWDVNKQHASLTKQNLENAKLNLYNPNYGFVGTMSKFNEDYKSVPFFSIENARLPLNLIGSGIKGVFQDADKLGDMIVPVQKAEAQAIFQMGFGGALSTGDALLRTTIGDKKTSILYSTAQKTGDAISPSYWQPNQGEKEILSLGLGGLAGKLSYTGLGSLSKLTDIPAKKFTGARTSILVGESEGIRYHFGSNQVPDHLAKQDYGISGTYSRNIVNKERLNSQLHAEQISKGHAFDKHIIKQGEFPSWIRTRQQLQNYIENTFNNPKAEKIQRGSAVAYIDRENGVVIYRNYKDKDGGTVFQPTNFKKYLKDVLGIK